MEKDKKKGYKPRRKEYTGEDIEMLREAREEGRTQSSSYAYRYVDDAA